jgi:hypothetical protein
MDGPRSLVRSLCLRAVLSYYNGGFYEGSMAEFEGAKLYGRTQASPWRTGATLRFHKFCGEDAVVRPVPFLPRRKAAKLAQKLDQLQHSTAVSLQECRNQRASSAPTWATTPATAT